MSVFWAVLGRSLAAHLEAMDATNGHQAEEAKTQKRPQKRFLA
jgi:hypothetical protein